MIDRRIKFRHIQCFAEIVRHNSLKSAAQHLHLTQPAISKTLKELEEVVGSDLLVRNRGGVSLTKQGEVFLHFAQMSLAALQQGLNGVAQMDAGGAGQPLCWGLAQCGGAADAGGGAGLCQISSRCDVAYS